MVCSFPGGNIPEGEGTQGSPMSETEKVRYAVRTKLGVWSDREEPPSMFDPIIREELMRRFWLDRKSPLSLGLQLYQKGVLTAAEACWLDDLD